MNAIETIPEQTEARDVESIGDYAVIGNCQTLALVSRSGSIDWLCLPEFSSPSVFAALLDRQHGGRFVVRPREIERIERGYLGDSTVLRTTFHCRGGVLCLTDAMTVLGESDARQELLPQHELLRLAECRDGEVVVDVLFQFRPDYGRCMPRLTRRGRLGWLCSGSGVAAYVDGDLDLQPVGPARDSLAGSRILKVGECCRMSFACSENDIAVLTPLDEVESRLRATCNWWQDWAAHCVYRGPYRAAVLRSCLTLKLLTYHLSGAVIAAATTSLPEVAGGERNWDYRYCWLRDASMLLQSFVDLGYPDESEAFLDWLLHATRLTQPHLQVLYNVHGETNLQEFELDSLAGYQGRGPVRIGNAAGKQVQHDVYGQVLLTALRFVEHGGQLSTADKRLLVGFGKVVRTLWRRPDHGIWEIRLPPRHNVHSKLMCWVALDSLIALHRRIGLDIDDDSFIAERERIRDDIETHGYDARLNSYVGYYGGSDPDAALLLMPRYGFVAADHPRMVATCRHIRQRLTSRGLLHRYPPGPAYDGVAGEENPFVICNFWLVDYLARLGEVDEARALFERLLGLTNDLGLCAEEFDLESGRPMGNFPQAFSHEGLITAALSLQQATAGRRTAA